MRKIPECLSRRYKALDELMEELNGCQPSDPKTECASTDDPGIKLMCEFWNILKEDPNVNLKRAVEQRMRANDVGNSVFGARHVSCYRSGCSANDDKKREALNKIKQMSKESPDNKSQCCTSKSETSSVSTGNDNFPLNKVLCNLKEAASFDKKCEGKVNHLLETQKELQEQIQILEQKEKDGIHLIKQADCMWSCMEDAYKKKIAESLERQNGLLKQLKEVELSHVKWRKNKKDLEFQINTINKCYQEIQEKIKEKTNDIKCIEVEIVNFQKHIKNNKSDLEVAKKSFCSKKKTSDSKLSSIASDVTKLEKDLSEKKKYKSTKEQEGTKYIKEAREELQKLCKVLLQKKLENENLNAEKDSLLLEIELLIQSCDQCRDKCNNKGQTVEQEIKKIDKEIADFKHKCIRCHECVDTSDIRKYCLDCPRCLAERDCSHSYNGGKCSPDHTMDCVCMSVKQKLLDNIFDNMYTLLERNVKSGAGNAVAEEVLNCLKKSRNGKLNEATRKILQDFILTTVKKNLNLTIVGGAVKTRCEMDPETYNQLMLCLKQVEVIKPMKTDTGTEAKKEPCERWGSSSECNCPKGSKGCICSEKAPQIVIEPTSCPPQRASESEDIVEAIVRPHKDSTPCGPGCGMHGMSNVGSEVAAWRPSPCQGPTCQFKNMRAAQCVLGPEILSSARSSTVTSFYSPTTSILENKVTCNCSGMPNITCVCQKDSKEMKVKVHNPCDKEPCARGTTDVKRNSKNMNKINISDIQTKDMQDNKTQINNISPIVKKALSGNIKELYDTTNNVELTSHKVQDDPNLFLKLKETLSVGVSVDLFLERGTSNNKNAIIKCDKAVTETSLSDVTKSIRRTENTLFDECCNHDKVQPQKNFTHLVIDTIRQKESRCKIKSKNNNQLFEVRITDSNYSSNNAVFVIRQTGIGDYEVILDKEFEKWYFQTIKEDRCEDDDDEYVRLDRTDSGNFILNIGIKEQNNPGSKKALIIRSQLGNIKLLVIENKSDIELIKKTLGTVISPRTLSSQLDRLPHSNKDFHRKNLRKSRMITTKCNSDSNVYGRVKLDVHSNENLVESKAILKKTNSGQYAEVLDKESKAAFINNLKKKLRSSAKGFIPINRTNSGNVAVSLYKDNRSQYGSLKITQSGMYIVLNKNATSTYHQNTKAISTNNHTLLSKKIPKISKLPHLADENQIISSKAINNTYGQCKDNPCTKIKYIKDLKFDNKKSDTWYNDYSNEKLNNEKVSEKHLPHIVIKACESSSKKESSITGEKTGVKSICPYHIGRYKELSNEIMEISGPCQRTDLHIDNKNEKYQERNPITKADDTWDNLKFLPPQLPPFLKCGCTFRHGL